MKLTFFIPSDIEGISSRCPIDVTVKKLINC